MAYDGVSEMVGVDRSSVRPPSSSDVSGNIELSLSVPDKEDSLGSEL